MTEARRWWLLQLALVAVCFAIYAPGLTAGLTHYDDSLYLYHNEAHLDRPGLSGFLHMWDSTRVWNGEFVEFFPLRDSVYWAIYQGWKLEGTPYHVVDLLFHIAATLLALRLALQLGLSRRAAMWCAFLFAVHPIHIESVLWAAGLKDPMYTTFMFASLLAFGRYRRHEHWAGVALSMGMLTLSLLVKSMAISAPLIMVLMDRFTTDPPKWRTTWLRVAGPAALAGAFFLQFMAIGKANKVMVAPHGGSWPAHVVLTAWAQVKYLKQSLVPSSFRLIYCFDPPSGLLDWRFGVALLVFAAVVVLTVRWRREPLWLLCLGWYVACLLPVSNLVPFPAVMADRYLYAAVFAVCVLVARALDRWDSRLNVPVAVVVVVMLGLTTLSRAGVWQDEELLWEEPDLDPECLTDRSFPAAHAHLLRYWASKDREVGLQALERAMQTPGRFKLNLEHYCDVMISATKEAAELGDPLRARPWAREAAYRCPHDPLSWNALMQANMHAYPRIAAGAAEKAYRLYPNPVSKTLRALTRIEFGQLDSIAELDEVVREHPSRACPVLWQWAEEVEPVRRALVDQSLGRCGSPPPKDPEAVKPLKPRPPPSLEPDDFDAGSEPAPTD